MKKHLLTIILAVASVGVMAQENGNRDASGKIVRGPYETNKFFDNVFVGVGGGINFYVGEGYDEGTFSKRLSPALDVSVGKWVTPSVGLRLQYSGLKAKGYLKTQTPYTVGGIDADGLYETKFNVMNLHGDVMWNLSNAIGGYKETRLWNFIPYVGAGWARSTADEGDGENNELAVTVGLLNTIRLSDAVNLTLEARGMIVNQRFDGIATGRKGEGMASVTVGVAYKFNKRNFVRVKPVPDCTPYINKVNSLESDLSNANATIKDLKSKLANQKPAPAPAPKPVVEKEVAFSPVAVFFQIGNAEISAKDIINLGYAADAIKANPNDKYVISGYADKTTGSAARNQQLSEMRAKAVYNVLVNKYGVDANQLSVVANGSKTEPFDKATLNRVAIVKAK